jgi:hypothetical protein
MAQFSVKIMRLTGSVLGENQQMGLRFAEKYFNRLVSTVEQKQHSENDWLDINLLEPMIWT